MKLLVIAIMVFGFTGCSLVDSVTTDPCKGKKFISKWKCERANK